MNLRLTTRCRKLPKAAAKYAISRRRSMETILGVTAFACLFLYIILALWNITIVCGPPPENGKSHTKIELEVNWNINRPPILFTYPWLSLFVQNNLLFYWLASILSVVLVFLKTNSFGSTILAVIVFFAGAFISVKVLQTLAFLGVVKYFV